MSSDFDSTIGDLRSATGKVIEDLARRLDKPTQDKSSNNEIIARQQAILERVMESAAFIGEVISIRGDQTDESSDIIVSCYGRIITVKPLPGVKLNLGDMIKLAPNSSQIISFIDRFTVGSICNVRQTIDEQVSEVDFNGAARIVMNGTFGKNIETGDRVVLDTSGSIIISWLGKPAKERFKAKPKATWDDIVGLDEAKLGLREAIELPFKNDRVFLFYKRKPFKGAFFFGPPGCGKTMLGEAAANAMAELHGVEVMESGYFYVKGPEFLDMYVGNTEKGIRNLAAEAEEHFKKYGYPAIIFLDECEALLSRRGSGTTLDMEKTVVPTFLGVMNQSSAIFLLATNRSDVIDPAVIRHGRINRHFHITRPTKENSVVILEKNLAKYPIHFDSTYKTAKELAVLAADEFYSDKHVLIDEEIPLKNGTNAFFTLGQIVNGAMLTDGIVEVAATIAERRDRANDQLTGIMADDLRSAVERIFEEQRELDHKDELREFFKKIKDQFEPAALLQKSAAK